MCTVEAISRAEILPKSGDWGYVLLILIGILLSFSIENDISIIVNLALPCVNLQESLIWPQLINEIHT